MVTKPLVEFILKNQLLSSSEIISLHSYLGPESGIAPCSAILNQDNDLEFIVAIRELKEEQSNKVLKLADDRFNRTSEILEDDQMREEMRNISFQQGIINRQTFEKPAQRCFFCNFHALILISVRSRKD